MKKRILVLIVFAGMMAVGGCGHNRAPADEPVDEQNYGYPAEIDADSVASAFQNVDAVAPAMSLEDVLAVAYTRREGIIKPGKDAILELVYGRTGQTIDTAALRERPERSSTIVSTEDALYDAQVLFDILRQTYGPYIYFGGDEVFIPVFDEIVETLSVNEEWSVHLFEQVLFNALSPHINDNHSYIGRRRLGNVYNFWELQNSDDNPFDRSENGIRNRETGLYVAELRLDGTILHQEIEDVFRLTLNSEGEFYYSPVVVTPYEEASGRELQLTIVYENGDEENILLGRHMSRRIGYHAPTLEYHRDIPVVAIRGMNWLYSPDESDRASARRLLDFTDELQDEPVIIIDIRSNMGGVITSASMWLEQLLNENVPTKFISLVSRDYAEMLTNIEHIATIPYDTHHIPYIFVENHGFIRYDQLVESIDLIYGSIIYSVSNNLPDKIIPNDRLLIFLTDRFTSSAAEWFADFAFNIENTLVIGQNTNGMLLNGRGPDLFLPRSGVHVSPGFGMFVHPPGHLPEGIGLAPDIWVHGDALVATFAMLELQNIR